MNIFKAFIVAIGFGVSGLIASFVILIILLRIIAWYVALVLVRIPLLRKRVVNISNDKFIVDGFFLWKLVFYEVEMRHIVI